MSDEYGYEEEQESSPEMPDALKQFAELFGDEGALAVKAVVEGMAKAKEATEATAAQRVAAEAQVQKKKMEEECSGKIFDPYTAPGGQAWTVGQRALPGNDVDSEILDAIQDGDKAKVERLSGKSFGSGSNRQPGPGTYKP